MKQWLDSGKLCMGLGVCVGGCGKKGMKKYMS